MHPNQGSEEEKLDKKITDFEKKLHFREIKRRHSKKLSDQEVSFLRIGTEFVSGVIAGVILGLWIDHFFGTGPWGLIFFFVLGSCAGFFNIYRLSGKIKP